jgi:Phage-integrase repeat unit
MNCMKRIGESGLAHKREYLPFEEAKKIVRSFGFENVKEYQRWCKLQKPKGIPFTPENVYENEWKGYGDWLGTGRLATKDIEFLPFEEAKKTARSLRFKNNEEYKEYCRSENRHLPIYPNNVYKKEWKGWGDFLGTGNITRINREFLPFPKAKKFVHSLRSKDRQEYLQWCRSGQKPDYIPSTPHKVYKKEWRDG